jgi:hypothetical protein
MKESSVGYLFKLMEVKEKSERRGREMTIGRACRRDWKGIREKAEKDTKFYIGNEMTEPSFQGVSIYYK